MTSRLWIPQCYCLFLSAVLAQMLCVSIVFCQESPAIGSLTAEQDSLMRRGEAIYREKCIMCHGAKGEGVPTRHPEPLVGDATVNELAKVIEETMPEDDPEACIGKDAQAVAAFIHYVFYSETAVVRNRPPRIGVARLTGNQLRQSLADIYGHFSEPATVTNERGLQGTYFDGARWKRENKKLERIDATIDFDFGKESPVDGVQAKAFYISWEGALRPDASGRYEIIVQSTCSFVLDFGKIDRELINNHVQSGDQTEFRRSIYLTAGRVYPLKLIFVQRERKTEQPPAKISLRWVPPHGKEQVIPTQYLLNGAFPAVFSLQADLPPDDRSYGYERGVAIDRQWDDSTTAAGIEFGHIAADELWPTFKGRGQGADEQRTKLHQFLTELMQTAFRQSLNDALRKLYVDQQIAAEPDDGEAIKRAALVAVKSPRFLYPLLDSEQSKSQRAANRLALVLYDSLPSDGWLLELVRKNELESDDQIHSAAERMIDDYRARAKIRSMLHEWLNLTGVIEISKNSARFPDFTPELVDDLRQSLDLFLDDVVWSKPGNFRQFFQADWSFTNDRLERFYGSSWRPATNSGPAFRKTPRDRHTHAGLLTHPLLTSHLAYHDTTSPIHRGVFLLRHILGRTLRPPQDAFAPLSPDLHPDLTTRERVELQTSPEGCQVCHAKINNLGFAMENLDTVGRFRSQEKEKNINSAGHYTTRKGDEIEFNGVLELSDYLADSEDVRHGFVNRAFLYLVKQPPAAYGRSTVRRLGNRFVDNHFNIRELILDIALVAAKDQD